MLDDGHCGVGEVIGGPYGGVGVDVVVVAHRLAVKRLRLGEPGMRIALGVEGCRLMGVLPVTQGSDPLERQTRVGREARPIGVLTHGQIRQRGGVEVVVELLRGPPRDRSVVGGSVGEGERCQALPGGQREASPGRRRHHIAVPQRIHDDGD